MRGMYFYVSVMSLLGLSCAAWSEEDASKASEAALKKTTLGESSTSKKADEVVRKKAELLFGKLVPRLGSESYKVRDQAHGELLAFILQADKKVDPVIQKIIASFFGGADSEIETRLRVLEQRLAAKDLDVLVKRWRDKMKRALPNSPPADFVLKKDLIQDAEEALDEVVKLVQASNRKGKVFRVAELFLESGLEYYGFTKKATGAKGNPGLRKAIKKFEAALDGFERSMELKEVAAPLLQKKMKETAMLLIGSRKFLAFSE